MSFEDPTKKFEGKQVPIQDCRDIAVMYYLCSQNLVDKGFYTSEQRQAGMKILDVILTTWLENPIKVQKFIGTGKHKLDKAVKDSIEADKNWAKKEAIIRAKTEEMWNLIKDM